MSILGKNRNFYINKQYHGRLGSHAPFTYFAFSCTYYDH